MRGACWVAASGIYASETHMGRVFSELLYDPSLPQCVEEVTLSVAILWLRQSLCLWWKPTENSEHWCLKADVRNSPKPILI